MQKVALGSANRFKAAVVQEGFFILSPCPLSLNPFF